MDEIVLRFCYVDHHVDIKVDDIDKVMWMDLINEYEEEFRKNNYDMPEFPSFKYVVNGKSFKILSDTDIMTMFERLSSTKVIFISVGKLNTLSECVQAARKLKSSMMSGSAPKNVYFAKSPPRVRVDGNSQPPSSSDVDTSQTGVDNVEISLGGNEILNFDIEETWQDIQADLSEKSENPGKKTKTNKPTKLSVRKKKKMIVEPASQIVLSQLSSYSNAPIVEPSVIQPNLQHVVSFPKKIPRSTAARRQLVVVRGVQNPSVSHEAPIENLENVATVDNDPPIENETPIENVDNLVENETSTHNEMVAFGGISSSRSVRNGLGGQEGEGLQGDVHNDDEVDMEMIQDNYDPYEDEFWQNDVDNDDSYLKRIYKNGELYKDQEWGKIVIKPWMLFTDKQHFQQVLRDYCIQVGFAIVVEKSSPKRFTATCLDLNCDWRIHSSILPDGRTWAIKSIKNFEHTCRGLDNRNPLVNVEWAAEKLLEDVRANNDIPGSTLNDYLKQRYGFEMPKSSLYRMRTAALKMINGGHDESYSLLPKYAEMVTMTNSESAAFCVWTKGQGIERPLVFKSIFISFKGVIDGLATGCRSLIGVDGAHLKGHFGGVLLSAIAIDANNELYPFAWAIVSVEDEENWKFFITHLKNLLDKHANRGDEWCIISDRQKGIEPALSTVWPKVGRRYCCKHLAKNWKSAFGGPLMYSLFWRAASATSPFTFRKAMEKIQKANPEARIWLANLGDQERWTRHKFDPKICSEENKSNFVESFNATLGIDRCRPVLTLLEGVRRMCMVRMSTRRKKCAKWPDNEPCPNIITRIQKLVSDSRACKAYESGPGEYEISDGRSMLPVSLNNRTCICGLWQISGIPCKHAMRAILFAQQDPHKYTSTWYYGVVYKQAYCHTINSIPDHDNWPEIDMPSLHPPPLKRGVGRPARNRKREVGEVEKGKRSTTSRCTNCGEWGHNIRTCKGGLTAKQKKEQAQAKAQADNEAALPKQGKKRKEPASSSQPSTSTTQQKGKKHLVEACSSSQPLPSAQSSQQGCKSKDPCSSSQPIRRSLRLQNSP